MLIEKKIKEVLESLSNAGLCVCETSTIESHHPSLIIDHEYIIGRVEEWSENTRRREAILREKTELRFSIPKSDRCRCY